MKKILIIIASIVIIAIFVTSIIFFYNSSAEKVDGAEKEILPPNQEPTFLECMKLFTTTETNDQLIGFSEAVCYTKVARERDDIIICDNIKDESLKKICQEKFPQIEKCEEETDAYKKNFCFRELASTRRDLTLCDRVNHPIISKNSCYWAIAQAKKDESICTAYIKNTNEVDKCLLFVAGAKKDPLVCDNIKGSFDVETNKEITVEGCYEFVRNIQETQNSDF